MIDIQAPELLKSLPESIGEVIKRWAERSADRLALVENNGSWTYRQLDAVVTATVAWLRDSGVRPGDRVMLVCENCRAFIAIFLALTEMDGWPVLANARLSAREIDDIRDHCGARRVIYMTSVSPHATQHAKRHGAVIGEVAGLGAIGVGALNEQVEPEPIEKNSSSAERVAALIYTSGTTGLPKGVVLTHRNLLFIAAVSARIRSLTPEDRLYGVLPMSHAVGLSVVLLGTLLSGATLYLAPRFDPVAALATLERDRLTIVRRAGDVRPVGRLCKIEGNVRTVEISCASDHFFLRRTAASRRKIGRRRTVRHDSPQRLRCDGMLAHDCSGQG